MRDGAIEALQQHADRGAIASWHQRDRILGQVGVAQAARQCRMDGASRVLVHLGQVLGPWPEGTAVVLLTERGCIEVDAQFERGRRVGDIDRQAFAYTLPSTPIGEASIRLGLRGPGFARVGGDDEEGRSCVRRLLSEGAPAALLARVEIGGGEREVAWAERWEPA